MTPQSGSAESIDDLFADERLAAQSAEIEALIERAHGDPRATIGSLLVRLAEIADAVSTVRLTPRPASHQPALWLLAGVGKAFNFP